MEPDYASMTRLAAIELGGIITEVAWIKAHALTLSAEEIHDARQADILGADDYAMIMRARARRRVGTMNSYPVTFRGEACKVTHENPDGTLTVERQDRSRFPFSGIWFGVSPWEVEPFESA